MPACLFEMPACLFSPSHRAALSLNGLKQLLNGAPMELCCSVDQKLMTNPLRSPYGHAFELSVLAYTLAYNGNVCPLTGQPLSMDSCSPDGNLKLQVDMHINEWMHRAK
eukprot:TRINITY_DN22581_c0_g1_i1.p1 TRINITY_DN22581_c0_g1~~TRINITY_DN22581_c0_g1_i1.p1  ORF type:complete len:109 (-),score=12.70 TRINITY_DN22581_c0_g1_i1:89-415(-)